MAALTQNVTGEMKRVVTRAKRMNKNDPSLSHNERPSSKEEAMGGTEDCPKLKKPQEWKNKVKAPSTRILFIFKFVVLLYINCTE